jgi:hypothetical protein
MGGAIWDLIANMKEEVVHCDYGDVIQDISKDISIYIPD